MPYINIRIGASLTNEQKNKLYEQTTTLMNTIMNKRREVTIVHIQESESKQWSSNAAQLSTNDSIAIYVDIKVTQGTNTSDEKKAMIARSYKMLQDIVGAIQSACYIVIDEIPGDSWGYGGQTQAMRALL